MNIPINGGLVHRMSMHNVSLVEMAKIQYIVFFTYNNYKAEEEHFRLRSVSRQISDIYPDYSWSVIQYDPEAYVGDTIYNKILTYEVMCQHIVRIYGKSNFLINRKAKENRKGKGTRGKKKVNVRKVDKKVNARKN